ncbi:DUF2314 domain-containing protein [Variovorax sp. KBS0712]|uniref:DUF2314 domain-containing protein n=1 Tax=Variovorax sp. KBS0712 TaxID=2578111 RepID=UPI0011181EF8|nr:DUF2314 domain-containing protein [Variovorax sp. KBS0712]TSD56811.1 DUF2314 domain-containing protein [Variovorax sp. KBS0712]
MQFELDDGEARHEEAPGTFYIPPRERRANLQPGQLVKLVFRIQHDETVDVERMWVIVEDITATGYVGSLNNQPMSTDELQMGALVPFGPQHVIQIYEDE